MKNQYHLFIIKNKKCGLSSYIPQFNSLRFCYLIVRTNVPSGVSKSYDFRT